MKNIDILIIFILWTFIIVVDSASILPMTLKAAVELELLEIIKREGLGAQLSPAEIVALLPTKNSQAPIMLDRILQLLASYSILTCCLVDREDDKVGRCYGLPPRASS
ncbi:hypothetical protein Taro_041794 [Colocasia esculenta]|uniref:O-methyltransferase dimerisation domain-containing protein n=1 Tax=Colocasia esculenta TaxID=4460 RepID=A0A843WQY0_COLES|nr:hypothetical protein [Colocasia esculenta]